MMADDIELIINAEQALAKAHLRMDIDTIDALLHKDYTIVQPGGKIERKQDVLDSYKSGLRHWDNAELDELDAKIYGNMAKVTGLWKATGTNNGKTFEYQARFISIWIKEDDGWKNISYCSSALS
jgi:ketosteroid isomerase-like protein